MWLMRDRDAQMGICHGITAFKSKDKICFQNQLIPEVCTPLGILWKVISVSQKTQNAFDANATQFRLLKYYGQKVSWLIPHNHWIPL